jgi:hypothetical protein
VSRPRTARSAAPSQGSSIVWVTLDGREIGVHELEDRHLENIINMLDGRGMKSLFRLHQLRTARLIEAMGKTSFPSDEEAGLEMEAALSLYGQMPSHPHVKVYNNLLQEREMRKALGVWNLGNNTKTLRRP